MGPLLRTSGSPGCNIDFRGSNSREVWALGIKLYLETAGMRPLEKQKTNDCYVCIITKNQTRSAIRGYYEKILSQIEI